MFGLSILSAAWWAAKWALVKDKTSGATRWLNGSSVAAIAAAGVTLVVVLLLAYGLHTLRADAVAANDAAWQSRSAQSATARALRQAAANRRADAAADAERQMLYDEMASQADRVIALERELTRLQTESGGDDPIVYPRALAQEMRK